MKYIRKFLWLPKKINGKWHWLEWATVEEKTVYMSINGKITPVKRVKYIVKGV